ncbi:MAG TPA: DUF502 domain-containing protein [Nitrospiria bacterium]
MTLTSKHIKGYFFAGLLVVTPIWGTYLVLKTLFITTEGFLGDLLKKYIDFYIPGLGIVTLVLLIFFTGVLTTNFIGKKLFQIWEFFLRQVPIVRNIYSTIKSIIDTVSRQGNKRFNRVVLIEFPRKGQYSLAFLTGVTQGEVQRVTHQKVVNVYVPTTPNPTSGYMLMVPEEDIIPLSMTVEEGMKMIISGGFYSPSSPQAGEGVIKGNVG